MHGFTSVWHTTLANYPDAIDAFTQNIEIDPSNAPAYYHRGYVPAAEEISPIG